MKISFNPSNSNKNILDLIKNNKDIIFDLKGHSIFARGVEFKGTDTNTWRDIKINNVSIGSHTLDLRNGSNTTLTNTNGVVTINSTWRPVVDNLTSDSTTSSLSAKQGKVLKALIDGKSNSDHNHDGIYVRAFRTSNDNIDSDWGQSFKTFDPVPLGTPPEQNPNISLLSIGENFNRRKQLAFIWNNDNIYYRRRIDSGFTNWRRLAFTTDIPSSLKNPYSFNVFGVVYDGSAAKTVTTSNFISQLPEGTSTITDGTMLITSYASNSGFADTNAVNVPYKRKAIHLWEYIKAKTDSLYATKVHNHDGRYLRLSGQDTMQGNLYLHSHGTSYIGKGLGDKSGADFTEANIVIRSWWGISFKSYDDIVRTYIDTRTGNIGTKGVLNAVGAVIQGRVYNGGDDEGIIINPAPNGYAGLILGTHNGERSVFYLKKGNPFWRYNNGSTNLDIYHPKKSGTIALTSDIPNKDSWNYDDRYLKLTGDWMQGDINFGGDNKIHWARNTDTASISFKNDGDGDANSYMSFVTSDNGNEYFRWSHSSGSTNTEWMALRSDGLRVRGTKVSLEGHSHNDLYYTKAESNAKYITDIATSVNKLTFTRNGSNIARNITVNVVYSQGNLTNISNKDNTTKASSGLYIYNSYNQVIGTNPYSSVLSINTGGTIQIAGNWGDNYTRNLYWRSQSDRNVADYPWKSWRTILDSENYSSTLDSRYYTESEVNSLLDAKLNRQNLSYGNWNPRGWNLAADYHYNGGDISISESGGKIHVSVDGYFWQNEGQYRVLDTSDIGDIRDSVALHQYLSATDAAWQPLVWGGASHTNTSYSTGPIYKSYDKLSWQTSSQTLYATNIQTNNIKNLSIGGGIYWNPNVESDSDGSDAASITLVRSGVAGGTTLVLSQMNDTNDTIQFKTNTAARLYHNSYPILTTQNTYVNNNKGYINGNEITQVNNSDTLDGAHLNGIFTGFSYAQSRLTATIGTVSKTVNVTGSYPSIGGVTMNTIASYGNCMGMASLASSNSNPNNQTSWHHFINMSYNTESTNMWQTQFAIKAGTTEVWVRSRAGGSISDSSAWAAPWVRLARITDNIASATNADMVDGEHASSFVRAGHYESNDLNKLDTYSFIRSVNSNVSSTSPKGNTGWYNVIQLVHRNGASDGPSYIGQIALGMTTNTNDMFFRGKRTDPWKTVIHSGNYTEFINNYYWANVKISASSSTTTSPTVHTLTATRVCAGHNPGIDNSISCSNWFRSSGNTGWYNTTYYGGWYMSDTFWIRAHNGVGIYTSGQIYSSSSIRMSNILLEHTNEINNSANGCLYLNYRNSGNVSLCQGGGNVGIGTTTPSYKLDVNGQMRASGFHHSSVNSDNYILLAGGGYKSFGGDDSTPIFLGYLHLYNGNDGTISGSFPCLGYSVPFTYTRGGAYCLINIPNTSFQTFYIKAAIASVHYSGAGMGHWVGNHRGDGAWWLHCDAVGSNAVQVKGFHPANENNDSWWGGNPLYSGDGAAKIITVCLFGYVKFR